MSDQTVLAAMIRTRLLGVRPDDQDLALEDQDWRLIISALEAAPAPSQCALEVAAEEAFNEGWRTREARPGQIINSRGEMRKAWVESNAKDELGVLLAGGGE